MSDIENDENDKILKMLLNKIDYFIEEYNLNSPKKSIQYINIYFDDDTLDFIKFN